MSALREPASIDDAIEWFRKHFDGGAAEGVRVAYQYDLTGPGGGAFYARVDDGKLEVASGALPAPDVRFRLTAEDCFAVLAGRLNPDLLFTEDRLAVAGDLSLALKMRALFHPPR